MSLLGTGGVLIQGATGREGRMVAAQLLAYGTPFVGGVTPGKGGETAHDVPVFDSVGAALAGLDGTVDASVVIVPPLAVRAAVEDALAAGLRRIVITTEGAPRHDLAAVLWQAREAGTLVIGPNSVGAITPAARRKLGAIGGDRPERAFVPGAVGIISRSGGMTAELGLTLKRAGYGVSTAISVGGDELLGTPPAAAAELLAADGATRAICYFGEPGTAFEEDLAEAIGSGRVNVPVIALVAGAFTERLPEGTAFGHAAAIIKAGVGRPSDKRRLLAEAGATVVDTLDELADAVGGLLEPG